MFLAHFKISYLLTTKSLDFFLQGSGPVSSSSKQFESDPHNSARKGFANGAMFAEVTAQQRLLIFKIGHSGSCSLAISALAVVQVCQCCPKTRIRARNASGAAEASAIQDRVVHAEHKKSKHPAEIATSYVGTDSCFMEQ